MILRVWDYYDEFQCIADKCKDSCCIGWEIDIDEDTYAYYATVPGAFGKKLKKHMYLTKDKEYSFRLGEHGRCPFLNSGNLCDICIELGEEALSEVCTEYPRFSITYGDVWQKALCLSCEEVGRILFTHDEPVKLVDYEMPDYEEEYISEEKEKEEILSREESLEEEAQEAREANYITWLESMQALLISTLQNRTIPFADRVSLFLAIAKKAQDFINTWLECDTKPDYDREWEALIQEGNAEDYKLENHLQELADPWETGTYEAFLQRFEVFTRMEVLDEEWTHIKKLFAEDFTEQTYETLTKEYLSGKDYKENDYEQLAVYFVFRYFMNAVYNYDLLSYAKLAILFTRVILDMDVIRYHRNGKRFSVEDRIDTARIFSKEVEHSEENVELAREEVLF
ncbi:MAG: flagellin lysine-N-methylase [Agathobacter sp.]